MYKIGIAILAVIMYSCGQGPVADDHTATNQHEDEALQETLFTNNLEFYIEYDPLEVGEESVFLVHITRLNTYEPILSGKLSLKMGETSVSADAPEQAGIYHISMLSTAAGQFEVTYLLEANDVQAEVEHHVEVHASHSDLQASSKASVPLIEEEEHGHAETGEITFLKEQAWKGGFMVREIIPSSFSSVIHVSGEMMPMPGVKQIVSSNGEGFVSFAESQIVQGSIVEKGQKILTIISNSLNENDLGLRYRELLNTLNKSRSEYNRHKMLFDKNVISEKQFIASESIYESDSIRFYMLASRASANGIEVVAPSSGYIHLLSVDEGQFVALGQELFTISSDKTLLMRADIPQQYFMEVKDIETANFRTAYSDNVFTMAEFNGKLKSRVKSVAENSRYLPLYFEVENDGRLLEGSFVEYYLKSRAKEEIIAIPVSSLLEEQGATYVYVQISGESYTKRAVQIGTSDGIRVEVLSGLKIGERIVTEGVMLVKAASMVVVSAGDGHQH